MRSGQPWYLEDRAEALAIMVLTRRNDVLVRQHDGEHGIDLLVEVLKNGQAMGRVFGVELKAHVTLDPDRLATTFGSTIEEEEWLEDWPFPVALFVVRMQDDRIFFRWLSEPAVNDQGQPKLHRSVQTKWQQLDNKVLDEIITDVSRWYDTLSESLTA